MKIKYKKIVYKLYVFLKLTLGYIYDFNRYVKFSSTFKKIKNEDELNSRIFAHYHVIEKGLSFKEIRPLFGKEIIESLIELLEEYKTRSFNLNNTPYKSAISCLKHYQLFHKNKKIDTPKKLNFFLDRIKENNTNHGGVVEVSKKDIIGNKNFKDIVYNRHSVRNFSNDNIPTEKIINSIKIAQKSPSVCNRQSAKVYIIKDKKIKEELLKNQNGNRGFGGQADKLLIITSKLSSFYGSEEKNQNFIDAGLFSMTLMHALTYYDIASCPLNWCVDYKKDIYVRRIVDIGKDENIIMMILVGGFKETFKVAISSRKNTDDILEII